MRWCAAFLLTVALLAAPWSDALAERRVALVIGNAAYKEAPLANPVNDARAIAAKLVKLGYQVDKHENLGQREMTRAVTKFGDAVRRSGGHALFYYAGHGVQVEGRNFLIPVDAEIATENAVISEAVDVDIVTRQLDKSGKGVSIVILDACRDNPYERRSRGGGSRGLALIDAPSGTLIAYATAPGRVAADGSEANGVYTSELLKVMDEPGLRVEDVFKRVRAGVEERTGAAQTPWETSSIKGDFYFVPKGSTVTVTPSGAGDDAAEIAFWNSVANSADPADFEDYLKRYPNGRFTSLAERRLQAAQGRMRTVIVPPPAPRPRAPPKADPGPAVEVMDGEMMVLRRASLREAPSVDSKQVAALDPGARVAVTGKVKDANWYRVKTAKAQGFVFGDLVQDGAKAEEAEWRMAKEATASTVLVSFLQRFPDGAYKAEATAKRDTLSKEEAEKQRLATAEETRREALRKEEQPKVQQAAVLPIAPPPSTRVAPVHECDHLAGHPQDEWRVVPGIAFEVIKSSEAIRACTAAIQTYPDERRFPLQLARAYVAAKSYTDAERWYRKAIALGNGYAMHAVGFLYSRGYGVKQDHGEAVKWHHEAAQKGVAAAMAELGFHYRDGKGAQKNHQTAVQWFQNAADLGNSAGEFGLGGMYANGLGVEKNLGKARGWYEKAAARKHSMALNNLGSLYENGTGVSGISFNMERAIRYYREAKEVGNDTASQNLVRLCRDKMIVEACRQ